MKTDQTRRSFFATMALGISASAFPMLVNDFDDLANLAQFDSNELKDAEAWFKKLKESTALLMMEVVHMVDCPSFGTGHLLV